MTLPVKSLLWVVAVVVTTWSCSQRSEPDATKGATPAPPPPPASPERFRAPILAALRDPKLAFGENPAYVLDNQAFLDRAVAKISKEGDFFWHDRTEITARDAEPYAREEIQAYQQTAEGLAELAAKIALHFANPEVEEKRVAYPGRQLNVVDKAVNQFLSQAGKVLSGNPHAGTEPEIKAVPPSTALHVTANFGLVPARLSMSKAYGSRDTAIGVAHDTSDQTWFESGANGQQDAALFPRSAGVANAILTLARSHTGATVLIATMETMPYKNRKETWTYTVRAGDSLTIEASSANSRISSGIVHCRSQWIAAEFAALAAGSGRGSLYADCGSRR